ncbi:hypothetical protein [Gemmata sp.]|uniref:hypothetical protein n=1 Tax=Gemmata sp. TaxID=1914242 RepID=UPI003F721E87
MIPTPQTTDVARLSLADDDAAPRFFLDAAFNPSDDSGDWWLDLGAVHLPA